METIRLLLAFAAKQGWKVHQLDVKSVFVNGDLCEEVYVSHPQGFVKKDIKIRCKNCSRHCMAYIKHREHEMLD